MLLIQGPFPSNANLIVLPSPNETNTEGLTSSVQTIRKMDGSLNTYVKRRNGRKKFRWEFTIGHLKAKELEDYTISFSGEPAMIIWNANTYIGYLTLNPFEMSGLVSEFYRVTLEFEEKP